MKKFNFASSLAKTPRQRLEAWKPPRAVYELLVSIVLLFLNLNCIFRFYAQITKLYLITNKN